MNLTPGGGRVLLAVVTAFTCMAGGVLGLALGGLIGLPWVALGLVVAGCSIGSMIGAASIEYVRRAPHLSRVMATAGIAGVLFPFPVLTLVPALFAFPVLSLLVGGSAVWVDVRTSQRTGWAG